MIPAPEALRRLQDGNRRFVSGTRRHDELGDHSRRSELVQKQHPFAIILSCSDSRVPPEILFDQGLGDLFVVRVAGNIAGPTQIGSIEFAALQFGARLVVVLGHSRCGAVLATLEHLDEESADQMSPYLRSIVDLIRPAVAPSLKQGAGQEGEGAIGMAVRANVEESLKRLRRSGALEHLGREDGLVVLGAEYSLDTGSVEFFDEFRDTPTPTVTRKRETR